MEFKKERCYSALNADELRAGDKVILANDLTSLKEYVPRADEYTTVIKKILEDRSERRFMDDDDCYSLAYLVERKENCSNCGAACGIGYKEELKTVRCNGWMSKAEPKTEKKAEKHTDYNHCEEARKAYAQAMSNACPYKHYRPFKDTDELIKVWNAKIGTRNWGANGYLTLPYIWVQSQDTGIKCLITEYADSFIAIDDVTYDMRNLLENLTFLDGSPCGVEE